MPINFRDKISFLFNSGRGIDPTQVEWSVNDAELDARITAVAPSSFSGLAGQIADGQIPASIMRDAEFTAATVRNLLNLTSAEANDLFVGATISGQLLTFTQNDGSTVPITIPTAMAGTGDGVVQSGAISGTDLVLTLDNGGTVTIDIDALATDAEIAGFQSASQVNTLIQTALAAAVTGNTETGIIVTHNPDGTFDFVVAGVAIQHDLIVGWSDNDIITDAEMRAGGMSTSDRVTIPTGTGNAYLFAFRADADGGDPTEVHISSSGNQRNTFGAAVARTLDGTPGQLIVTVTTQNRALLGGETLRVV